nr:uncharacterized protein LOC115254566 [Aedes albopictus]
MPADGCRAHWLGCPISGRKTTQPYRVPTSETSVPSITSRVTQRNWRRVLAGHRHRSFTHGRKCLLGVLNAHGWTQDASVRVSNKRAQNHTTLPGPNLRDERSGDHTSDHSAKLTLGTRCPLALFPIALGSRCLPDVSNTRGRTQAASVRVTNKRAQNHTTLPGPNLRNERSCDHGRV